MFQPLLRRQRLWHKTSARDTVDSAGSRRLEGEKQLGRRAAELSKYYRLYLYSGKVTLAAIYLRRVRVICRSFAPALTHVSTTVTPSAPAAKYFDVGLWRPCRDQTCVGVLGAMARIALARPATPPNGSTNAFSRGRSAFVNSAPRNLGGGTPRSQTRTQQLTKFFV
jgi:hypothetical protein